MKSKSLVICAVGLSLLAPASSFAALSLLDLGTDSGAARAVNTNGSVVVGSRTQAWRWTAGSGITYLGYLPGGSANSHAFGVSDDGAVVVGYSPSTQSTSGEAYRWT